MVVAYETDAIAPADEVISISTEKVHGYRLIPGGLFTDPNPVTTVTGKPLT